MNPKVAFDKKQIKEFCNRWNITQLSVFGSALGENFRDGSDVDFLVEFSSDDNRSLLDHVAMEEELSKIVNRKVDLVSQQALERSENWIRRESILKSAVPVYAKG